MLWINQPWIQANRRAALREIGLEILNRGFGLWRVLKHRREVVRLTELDDRSLKDIGLLRSDVEGALAEPFSADPSRYLIMRRLDCRRSSLLSGRRTRRSA